MRRPDQVQTEQVVQVRTADAGGLGDLFDGQVFGDVGADEGAGVRQMRGPGVPGAGAVGHRVPEEAVINVRAERRVLELAHGVAIDDLPSKRLRRGHVVPAGVARDLPFRSGLANEVHAQTFVGRAGRIPVDRSLARQVPEHRPRPREDFPLGAVEINVAAGKKFDFSMPAPVVLGMTRSAPCGAWNTNTLSIWDVGQGAGGCDMVEVEK